MSEWAIYRQLIGRAERPRHPKAPRAMRSSRPGPSHDIHNVLHSRQSSRYLWPVRWPPFPAGLRARPRTLSL